jgi:biotin operon repressor
VRRSFPNAFPWTPELLALLGQRPEREVAARAGVALNTVVKERRRRRIEPFLRMRPRVVWTAEMVAALGTDTDPSVAAQLGIPKHCVQRKRSLLGIPPYRLRAGPGSQGHPWSPEELALLGRMSDGDVGREIGLSGSAVSWKRRRLGISPFQPAPRTIDWTGERLAVLGTLYDEEVAERLGVSEETVNEHRRQLGIASHRDRRRAARKQEVVSLLHLPTSEVQRRTGATSARIAKLRREYGIRAPGLSEWRWSSAGLARLGNEPDSQIAADLGGSRQKVAKKRLALRIPAPLVKRWSREEIALLGTASDSDFALRLGRTELAVAAKRRQLGISKLAEVQTAKLRCHPSNDGGRRRPSGRAPSTSRG